MGLAADLGYSHPRPTRCTGWSAGRAGTRPGGWVVRALAAPPRRRRRAAHARAPQRAQPAGRARRPRRDDHRSQVRAATHEPPHRDAVRRHAGAARHQLRPGLDTGLGAQPGGRPAGDGDLPRRHARGGRPGGDAGGDRRGLRAGRRASTPATSTTGSGRGEPPDPGVRARASAGRQVPGRGTTGRTVTSGIVASAGRSIDVEDRVDDRLGADPARGVVGPPLLLVHLLLHRRRGAAGVDRADPHPALDLLGPQRVGEGAQAELRGGVRRPLRRWRRARPRSSRRPPCRGPRARAGAARGSARPAR